MIELIIWLGITGAVSVTGYVQARRFVRRKLRFVGAVQHWASPVIAGGVAALVASPVAALPVVTLVSAGLFGVGVGLGVSRGAKDTKQLRGM